MATSYLLFWAQRAKSGQNAGAIFMVFNYFLHVKTRRVSDIYISQVKASTFPSNKMTLKFDLDLLIKVKVIWRSTCRFSVSGNGKRAHFDIPECKMPFIYFQWFLSCNNLGPMSVEIKNKISCNTYTRSCKGQPKVKCFRNIDFLWFLAIFKPMLYCNNNTQHQFLDCIWQWGSY